MARSRFINPTRNENCVRSAIAGANFTQRVHMKLRVNCNFSPNGKLLLARNDSLYYDPPSIIQRGDEFLSGNRVALRIWARSSFNVVSGLCGEVENCFGLFRMFGKFGIIRFGVGTSVAMGSGSVFFINSKYVVLGYFYMNCNGL